MVSQPFTFRCDVAGGYACAGPGACCGIPCDGYPGSSPVPCGERAPQSTTVGWYCWACAAEPGERQLWELRAYHLCPACGRALELVELGGGVPARGRTA